MTDSKIVVKSQYFCSMKESTTLYWDQHPQQHVITVTTFTINHP